MEEMKDKGVCNVQKGSERKREEERKEGRDENENALEEECRKARDLLP
uniref:Uncharacterized protein n=1 Tax=Peronospora matthiolae TaxID=2874970 RepID=A0AAV1VCN0_9STRA